MIVSVLFSGSPNWLGSAPTWAILVGLFAAWRISRGGGGTAVSELSEANRFLGSELEKTKQKAEDQSKQIAVLESKTDVVLAVTPLMAAHENNARERHEASIEVLGAIRDEIKELHS